MSSDSGQSSARPGAGVRLRGLIALNAALLLVLATVTFAPLAGAQARARGEYLMVGGRVPGSDSSAVYVVDTVNQEMLVVNYNQNSKQLGGIGYRNLAADAANMTQNNRQRRQ